MLFRSHPRIVEQSDGPSLPVEERLAVPRAGLAHGRRHGPQRRPDRAVDPGHLVHAKHPALGAPFASAFDDEQPRRRRRGVGRDRGHRGRPALEAEEAVERDAQLQLSADVHQALEHAPRPVRHAVQRPQRRHLDERGRGQREPFAIKPKDEHARRFGVDRLLRLLEDAAPGLEIAFGGLPVEERAGRLGQHRAVAAVDECLPSPGEIYSKRLGRSSRPTAEECKNAAVARVRRKQFSPIFSIDAKYTTKF